MHEIAQITYNDDDIMYNDDDIMYNDDDIMYNDDDIMYNDDDIMGTRLPLLVVCLYDNSLADCNTGMHTKIISDNKNHVIRYR